MEAYLDNSATTKPFDAVCEYMNKLTRTVWGNPSSLHKRGLEAERVMKEARQTILSSLPGADGTFLFTSGGTEADNLAILGTVMPKLKRAPKIITTAIEHPAVTEPFRYLEALGARVVTLPVTAHGIVELAALEAVLDDSCVLVSVMQVNNEMGAIQPVEEISGLIHSRAPECLLHVDGVQGYGKTPLPMRGIDLYTISSHKINGPKGVGGLYVRRGVSLKPAVFGGGQETGLRSGTENVPAIGAFGLAAKITCNERESHIAELIGLRRLLTEELSSIDGAVFHSATEDHSAPHIINVSFPGVPAEVMLHALEEKGVYVSTGSACSSNHPAPSPTLTAMNVPRQEIATAIRFSLGYFLTDQQLRYAADCVKTAVQLYRL